MSGPTQSMSGEDALSVVEELKKINHIMKNEHAKDFEVDDKLKSDLMGTNKNFTSETYSKFVREIDPIFNDKIKTSIKKDPNVCGTKFEDTTLQNRVNYHCKNNKQSYQQKYKELKAKYIQLARRSLRQ
jgi:hypothetical protein